MIVPTTPQEAEAMVRDLAMAQTNREKAVAALTAETTAIEEKYARSIQDAETTIKIITETLATFATENGELFEDYSPLKLGEHLIGYTPGKWKVAVEESLDEVDVINALKRMIELGERDGASRKAVQRAERARFFLRTKHEIDKKRMLEESEREEVLEFLGEVGVYFTKEDKFFVRPARKTQKPAKQTLALA
jgi:phage host-nuclease inhibitor protein Gam